MAGADSKISWEDGAEAPLYSMANDIRGFVHF